MLFHDDLETIVFSRHEIVDTDELIVLSGYVGIHPVERIRELPISVTVVYGMFGAEGIQRALHSNLISLHNQLPNLQVHYSNSAVHSKCYVWKKEGQIVHALVGSANFSNNGLRTPFREVLAETTIDTFRPLSTYINTILSNSSLCTDVVIPAGSTRPEITQPEGNIERNICRMTLLDPRTNEVQNANGLNWGQNPRNHTNRNDANIPIRADYIRDFPNLFPPKQIIPHTDQRGRSRRHNDVIELIWDDGTAMEGLMEGSVIIDGSLSPKQISSFPEKSLLGTYIRNRIGVPLEARVTRRALEHYGRTHIDISLLGEGIYFMDFSV